jgi:hypothetical protein
LFQILKGQVVRSKALKRFHEVCLRLMKAEGQVHA